MRRRTLIAGSAIATLTMGLRMSDNASAADAADIIVARLDTFERE